MSERSEIKRLGAKPVKNSGRGINKADAVWRGFTVDIKEYKESFSLSRKVWAKLCSDSLTHRGTDPMLLVVLNGTTRLAVIELSVLEELLNDKEHHEN